MIRGLILLIVAAIPLHAAPETLRYTVNWASGLSLGEATMSTDNIDAGSAARRSFEFRLEASVPGFAVVDEVRAISTSAFCAEKLEKNLKHGSRSSGEISIFDLPNQKMERKTRNGGSKTIEVPACAKDALSFVYFLRQELKQGKLPAAQPIYFGAAYQIEIKYAGAANVTLGSGVEPADKFNVTIQGPASKNAIELFVGKDASRTPLVFRVPLPLGSFSMELQR